MIIKLLVLAVILYIGFTRCLLFNLPYVLWYIGYDVIDFFVHKKWRLFNYYGIDMFVGMFGHGKTLSMTHKARLLYRKYGDKIQFISNYSLKGIPYTQLINFNQLVDLGEQDSRYIGTVVLIDEIEDVLNNRNFANFPLALLNTLTQQRKKKVYIMCSAQRFFMVDKLFRSITTHVIDCRKIWRCQQMTYFDAWDYENAMNSQLVKPIFSRWWFIRNKDFECYNTEQMIDRNASSNFISNEENIVRLGLDATSNIDAIGNPSRKLRLRRKKFG